MFITSSVSRAMVIWTGTVNILLLTTFGLIAANFDKVKSLVGNEEISMYLLHIFFVAIGATAFMPTILKQSPVLIIWIAIAIYFSAFRVILSSGGLSKILIKCVLLVKSLYIAFNVSVCMSI